MQRTKPDKRSGEFSPEAGTRLYEPQYEEKQRFEHEAFLTQILERGEGKTKGKQIALIGEPGAGKTTLLQHIAFWVLGKTDSPRQQETKDVAIWVSLADLQGRSLEEYLLQTWLKKALDVVRVTPEIEDALADLFKSGQVWLLLDGIDEMTSGDPRQAIASQLTGWVASARVVLTCRLNVWQANVNFLADFETYRLLDFDYPQQVHQFIDNWFKNSDAAKGERLKAELEVVEQARLRDLIQNPLRLALLCSTWQSREGQLPQTKAGLYQKFVQQFYNWKQHCLPSSTQEQRELNSALGRLAKRDIDEGGSRFRLRESFISEELGNPDNEDSLFHKALTLGWLNDVGNAAESATEEKVYAFFHPTFEEYFAALAIDDWHFFLNHVPNNPNHPNANYRIFEPQWKEVILLWLGREDEKLKEQKEQFMQALVEFSDGCYELYSFRARFLAAVGIAEFSDFSRADEILAAIITWSFGYLDTEEHEWMTFAEPIQESARAALLETDRTKAVPALVEFVQNPQTVNALQAAVSLGKISTSNPDAVAFLVELTHSPDESTRLIAASSLGQIDKFHPNVVTTLIELTRSQDESTCRLAATSLGEIGTSNPNAVPALVELIHSQNIQHIITRVAALDSLGEIGTSNPNTIPALVKIIRSHPDAYMCSKAPEYLEKIGTTNDTVIEALVELIQDPQFQNENNPRFVAKSLGKIGIFNPKAVDALVNLIQVNPQNQSICRLAAEGLGEIGTSDPKAIKPLLKLIQSKNESTRCQAAFSLVKIDKSRPEAINTLVELIWEYQDEGNRWQAIIALGESSTSPLKFANTLVELIQPSQNEITRRLAAVSLVELDKSNPKAVDALVELIHSQNEITRQSAAVSLGRVSTTNLKAVNALVEVLRNPPDLVTHVLAAESLRQIGTANPDAVNALVEIVRNPLNQDVFSQAVESLGQIGTANPNAVTALVELVQNSRVLTIVSPADSLKKILGKAQMAGVVTALKDYLLDKTSAQTNEIGFEHHRSRSCLEIIWYCAQVMPYPVFYQAWHQAKLHPNIQENTGIGTTLAKQSLNLANLPEILAGEIAKDPNLCDKVRLICINGSKFIDRDNPATKIYNEMRSQGCPNYENGKPTTMAQLQDYWDELRLDSDRTLILVFYQSPTVAPQEFSATFLDTLSKFDGAICVVTDTPVNNLPLQQFSEQDSQLIENIIKWMEGMMLER